MLIRIFINETVLWKARLGHFEGILGGEANQRLGACDADERFRALHRVLPGGDLGEEQGG